MVVAHEAVEQQPGRVLRQFHIDCVDLQAGGDERAETQPPRHAHEGTGVEAQPRGGHLIAFEAHDVGERVVAPGIEAEGKRGEERFEGIEVKVARRHLAFSLTRDLGNGGGNLVERLPRVEIQVKVAG